MQILKHWRGEGGKKRPAEESDQKKEPPRKRMRDEKKETRKTGGGDDDGDDADEDEDGRRASIAPAHATESSTAQADQAPDSEEEIKIRGISSTKNVSLSPLFVKQSVPSPPLSSSSLSSSLIHPDRLANVLNATLSTAPASAPNPARAPASHQMDGQSPLSPSSPRPQRMDRVDESEGHSPKPLESTLPPNLHLETLRTRSSLDPRSPDYNPTHTSDSHETSHYSPSHVLREHLIDDSRRNSNQSPRRQSDIMSPPSNITRAAQSVPSTPKAASVPLLDNLDCLAHAITSVSIATMRRDALRQQAVEQQRERDRQSKFKHTFLTLIEDGESRAEGFDKVSAENEKLLNQSLQARSRHSAAVADALHSVHDQNRLKDDFAELRAEMATLKKKSDMDHVRGRSKDDLADLKAELKAEVKTELKAELKAQLKAEVTTLKKDIGLNHDRGRCKDDFADLKRDLQDTNKEIDYLQREAVMPGELRHTLRDLATKEELRELVEKGDRRELTTKDELRRVTPEEIRKHIVEALRPTEKKVEALTLENASLNQKIKGVEVLGEKHRETVESHDQDYSSRLDRLNVSLRDIQSQLSRLELAFQEGKNDYAANKVEQEAQNKVLTDLNTHVRFGLSGDDPSLDQKVANHSDQIRSLQEKLVGALQNLQDLEAASKVEIPFQKVQASVKNDTKIGKEIKLMGQGRDDLKAEQNDFKLFRHDLDACKADQEKIRLMRIDLDTLINEQELKDAGVVQEFEVVEGHMSKQQENLSQLQAEIRLLKEAKIQSVSNQPPTSPFANPSTNAQDVIHRRLQDLGNELKAVINRARGLDLVVQSQQQKFEGLTSDHLVQCMVHQMKLLYPQHPGWLVDWQTNVDRQVVYLRDRLTHMESRIGALPSGTPRKEVLQIAIETQEKYSIAMKQEFERLRDKDRSDIFQSSLNYGNRISELGDRMATIEARYIKAINDIETNIKEHFRNHTHLQNRNGIESAKNSPQELAIASRSSKNAESMGKATVSDEADDDSDGSDTPLSHRADRRASTVKDYDPNSQLTLKRKAPENDGEEEEDDEARATNGKKIARLHISGTTPTFYGR